MVKNIDKTYFIGNKFNRLTVTGVFRKQFTNRTVIFFNCICDCGKHVEANCNDVMRGKHKSCGCLHMEKITKHGHSPYNSSLSTSTYRSWLSMKQRCNNPQSTGYNRYGGRGITICESWNEFQNFLKDMGEKPTPKHTIDRINNDGNYEPSNCKWSTRKEQAQNRSSNPRWEHRIRNSKGQFS